MKDANDVLMKKGAGSLKELLESAQEKGRKNTTKSVLTQVQDDSTNDQPGFFEEMTLLIKDEPDLAFVPDLANESELDLTEEDEKPDVFSAPNIVIIEEDQQTDYQNNHSLILAEKMRHYTKDLIDDFMRESTDEKLHRKIKTGFAPLDQALGGGLYDGLGFLGATTGAGKSSIVLQMADYMAEHGEDVILFALEMTENQMLARSFSRITFEESMAQNKPVKTFAKTADELLTPQLKANWSKEERSFVSDCITNYSATIGEHAKLISAFNSVTARDLFACVDQHIKETGRKPVVFVDYLQILKRERDSDSDTTATDKLVTALKWLSMKYSIPVIAVSSFNRDSYSEPVSRQSFRQSGMIEYTADWLFAVQPHGFEFKDGDEKAGNRKFRLTKLEDDLKKMKKAGKKIWTDFKILKNRFGYEDSFFMNFEPKFSHFSVTDGTDWKKAEEKKKASRASIKRV